MPTVMNKTQAISAFTALADSLVTETVTARGSTRRAQVHNLLRRLELTGFYEAPASSAHTKHLAVEGGLAQHTYHVISAMMQLHRVLFATAQFSFSAKPAASAQDIALLDESCVIIGLCHDLNKGVFYGTSMYEKNLLASGKQSEAKPYARADRALVGGNIESIMVASRYIDLKADEAQAIAWCEGLFNRQYMVDIAGKEDFLTILAHQADMMACHLVESHEPLARDHRTFDGCEPVGYVAPPAPHAEVEVTIK